MASLPRQSSLAFRLALAALAVAVATGLRLLLDPWLGDLFPFATLFLAVLIVAWYGGFAAAATAALLGALTSMRFLLPPRESFAVAGLENQAGLVLYLLVSFGIAVLGGAMRAARVRAEGLAAAAAAHVAEQQRTEQALRESEQRYRQIVERAHEGIWQLDGQGRTRFANLRMAEMLRCNADELTASSIDDFLDEPGRDEVERLRQRRMKGISEQVEIRLTRRDGSELWALLSASPTYDAQGKYDGVLGMLSDLTEWKEAERETRLLADALRESDRRKDEFLALLGHELRNPLAPISNALQILKLPQADRSIAERARGMMERQVEHLVRLVDDLLDVSRIMSGKVELRREPVELATIVARAVETAQPVIDAEGHQLAVDLPREPLWVNGDVVRLAQVIANLLNNAAKYTERGGTIMLTAAYQGSDAILRIRDTGIGIEADLLPRIFDMFFQAERRTKEAQGGLGIGLSLVRGLVELHGGSVEAHSAGKDSGSEFIVRLPRLERDAAAAPAIGDRRRETPSSFPSTQVLVVDDNVDAADSLAMLLRLEGLEVSVAYDGATALAQAERDPPTVAFLDLGMPKMDGHELAQRFRQSPVLKDVVLVALTGWGQPEDRQRTRESGFDQHLVKPVASDDLRRVLAAPARVATS